MWFEIDYKKLVILLLPTFLRKTRIVYFFQSLITPLIQLHYDWSLQRERNLYKLQHNGQVCYLRKALNDEFDSGQRRIEILEGNKFGRQYIYTHAEQQPKYLGTMYIRPSSDYEDTGVDFIVAVPNNLIFNQYDMISLVELYKLASKRYKIERI